MGEAPVEGSPAVVALGGDGLVGSCAECLVRVVGEEQRVSAMMVAVANAHSTAEG